MNIMMQSVAAVARRKASLGASSYYDQVMADSPLAYWRLGEASGTTAADETANNYDGTYVGSPTLGVTSALPSDANTAITLTEAQYVEATGVADLTGDWTVEAWVKPSATANSGRMIYSRWATNSTGRQIAIYITNSGNYIQVDVPFVAAILTGTTALSNGTWYHIAVKRESNAWTIYVNGVSDATTTNATAQESNGVVRLGRPETTTGTSSDDNAFAGSLDEVAIYSSALSGTRIAAHYAAA